MRQKALNVILVIAVAYLLVAHWQEDSSKVELGTYSDADKTEHSVTLRSHDGTIGARLEHQMSESGDVSRLSLIGGKGEVWITASDDGATIRLIGDETLELGVKDGNAYIVARDGSGIVTDMYP